MSAGAGKPARKAAVRRERPKPSAPAEGSTNILVGDQISTGAEVAAAAVPAARRAQVVAASEAIGTPEEQLRVYEAVIQAAHETARGTMAAARARFVVEVGMALEAIRAAGLYRATHATFEGYAEGRWGISRPRAYQLITAAPLMVAAARVVDDPIVEAQARALAPVLTSERPETAREVIAAAREASGGRLTAAGIRKAVRAAGYTPPAAQEKPAETGSAASAASAIESLSATRERLARVARNVSRAGVRRAHGEHPHQAARLVRDMTTDLVQVAAALGLTVSRDGRLLTPNTAPATPTKEKAKKTTR
ncbi:hypothetical protein [Embleya sp. NPDC059237]|uniref:hypothetical protein n=1 Tax=Embleya sp. NPDC059237 TaxID=3346784 RepID=UPI00369DEAA0